MSANSIIFYGGLILTFIAPTDMNFALLFGFGCMCFAGYRFLQREKKRLI